MHGRPIATCRMCPPQSWSCLCASCTTVLLLASPVAATSKEVTARPSSALSIEAALLPHIVIQCRLSALSLTVHGQRRKTPA